MRIALITFFCCLFIILATTIAGIDAVVNGSLNVQKFFIESVQSEFNVWSQRLMKVDDRLYYNDKRSCPDDLCHFMERFGILSVQVSRAGGRVEWLLDGKFRVRVRYICLLNDGTRRQDDFGSWIFKVDNESISVESFLSILNARRDSCKTWIVILCISFFVIMAFCRLKIFHRIKQKMPYFAWFVMMYIVWIIDMFLVCLVGMSVWISVMEWVKLW